MDRGARISSGEHEIRADAANRHLSQSRVLRDGQVGTKPASPSTVCTPSCSRILAGSAVIAIGVVLDFGNAGLRCGDRHVFSQREGKHHIEWRNAGPDVDVDHARFESVEHRREKVAARGQLGERILPCSFVRTLRVAESGPPVTMIVTFGRTPPRASRTTPLSCSSGRCEGRHGNAAQEAGAGKRP